MREQDSYSIGQLAEAAGVSRRTVRFYVQRELLPPPEGLGRSAHYTARHLERLLQIKGWQEQEVPLEEIRTRLSAGPDPALREPCAPGPHTGAFAGEGRLEAPGSPWFRQPLAAGFELHVGAGRQPLRASQLAALSMALTRILEDEGDTQ